MAETYKETKTMLEELISAFLRILFDRMASREMVNFTDRLQQRVEKEMDNITKSIGSQPATGEQRSDGKTSCQPTLSSQDIPSQPATGEQRSDGKTSSRLTLSSQDISTLLAQLNQAMSQQQKEIALLRQELAQLTAAISVGQCRLVDDRQIHECTALKVEHSTIEHAED
jgi:uncharacterized coiled-coil protein SlyX